MKYLLPRVEVFAFAVQEYFGYRNNSGVGINRMCTFLSGVCHFFRKK